MHSIWLTPEPQARSQIRGTIRKLAEACHLPAFEPHITFVGDLALSYKDTVRLCESCLTDIGPIRARVRSVDGTKDFYRSLFLETELTPDLTVQRRALLAALQGETQSDFRPHISLAYGAIDAHARGRLIADLTTEYVGFEFHLSSVDIARSSRTTPIESWRCLWRRTIAQPAGQGTSASQGNSIDGLVGEEGLEKNA